MFSWRKLFPISVTVLFVASALLLPKVGMGFQWLPNSIDLVGTNSCPKLNAHHKKACRFKKGGHGFQVWPRRIQIQPTTDQTVFIVTDTGHKDLMFDHTLRFRKDDHIKFQCLVKNDGTFFGPINFKMYRGGVWAPIGRGIGKVTLSTAKGIASIFSATTKGIANVSSAISKSAALSPGTSGDTASATGGTAADDLKKGLAKFRKGSWEKQAGNLAIDICSIYARQGKQNWAKGEAAEAAAKAAAVRAEARAAAAKAAATKAEAETKMEVIRNLK